MTAEELNRRLKDDRIVRMPAAEWVELAEACEVVERHDTQVAGELLIVRCAGGLAALEQPAAGERVLRRLSDAEEAQRFVQARLEAYERMWDGCGCKIDYYK
ncbi:MAG: hypothetical protein GTO46_13900 [Gemmatimonadetes bacterium]|nr:hypothetical protein [Gemmatimonadota bacterium]NIO32678.1 hypothetical protein [Gemmatimonadota bacterium]